MSRFFVALDTKQILGQIRDVLVTFLFVFFQTALNYSNQIARCPEPASDRFRLILNDLHQRVGEGGAYKRSFSRDHFVEHSANGKDVGALIDFEAACLFGAHIRASSKTDPGVVAASTVTSSGVGGTRAIPKSRIFASPRALIMMFAGLTSR